MRERVEIACASRGQHYYPGALFLGRTRERKVETEELPESQRDMSESPSQLIIKVILPLLSALECVTRA